MDQLSDWDQQGRAAQAKAAQAYERLLSIAERQDSGQAGVLASFIAASYSSRYPLDLFELRMLDVGLADDVLACIDALRWGRAELYKLVPNGEYRVREVVASWKISPAS